MLPMDVSDYVVDGLGRAAHSDFLLAYRSVVARQVRLWRQSGHKLNTNSVDKEDRLIGLFHEIRLGSCVDFIDARPLGLRRI